MLAYGSRKLSKTEQNYCTTWRELLAIVDFTSHFRQYLLGQAFIIYIDHSSLRWLTKMKEPERQFVRWLERLSEYSFEIINRPGRLHSNADSLSRRPCRQFYPCRLLDPSLEQLNFSHQAVEYALDSDINQVMLSTVGVVEAPPPANTENIKPGERVYLTNVNKPELFGGWSPAGLRHAQEADPDITPIITWRRLAGSAPYGYPWHHAVRPQKRTGVNGSDSTSKIEYWLGGSTAWTGPSSTHRLCCPMF